MRHYYQRGSFLLEALLALVILGGLLGWASNEQTKAVQIDIARKTADYNNAIISAATAWIRNNAPAAKAGATATLPFVLDLATLKAANLIDTGYAAQNRYNQTPCVLILQSAPGKLAAMFVTEGGDTLDLAQMMRIAARTYSGAITDNVGAILTAKGTAGIYNIALTNYANRSCSGTSVSAGRVAAALVFDINSIAAPFLYTTTVTGNPNANTMFTNLNMNSFNVNNVGTLNATTVNATTLSADCFVSNSNAAYYVCPASNSVVNAVTGDTIAVNRLFGRSDASFYVTPDLVSNVNALTAETITARAFYDKDNAAFFVDPAADSVLRDAFISNRRSDVRLSNFMANFVESAISVPLGDGGVVAAATCLDGGQTSIYLIPQNIHLPADLIIRPLATLAGSNWLITVRDGSNSPVADTTYFAKLGCYFA